MGVNDGGGSSLAIHDRLLPKIPAQFDGHLYADRFT
jgi:hypothetical protein